jgi:signal transduction histidine kinase
MEDMGGRVSVTSKLGRGTEVVLHFPVADLADQSERIGAQRKDSKFQI